MHFGFDTQEWIATGLPSVTVWQGSDYVDCSGAGRRVNPIHNPNDEYTEDWNRGAIEQHMTLYLAILRAWASGPLCCVFALMAPSKG